MEGFDTMMSMAIAVKLFKKNEGSNQRQSFLEKVKADQAAEADVLNVFDHPNIIKLLHTLDVPSLGICLISPFMPRTLFDEIYDIEYQYSKDRCKKVLEMLFSGLQYMHDRNIMHRDIKPENVLVDSDGSIKLADLGLVTNTSKKFTVICGTPNYMASEIRLMCGYDAKIDIWVIRLVVQFRITQVTNALIHRL